MTEIQEIPVSALEVDERNVRAGKDVDVDELAEDIGENGLIQPIVVRPMDEGYGVVAGSRRYKACKEAGLDEIPCVVRDLDDDRALAFSVLENHSREDVDAREQVKAIERYFEESDKFWSPQDKKDKLTAPVDEGGFGFPRKTADDYLNILSLDKEVREKYDLSVASNNDVAGHKTELSLKQARKVGREMAEFSAEEQEEVIEAIEDKTFSESKEIIEEVAEKAQNSGLEVKEVSDNEEIDFQEFKKTPDQSLGDLSETFKQRYGNHQDMDIPSPRDKLDMLVRNELPKKYDFHDNNTGRVKFSNKDLYKLYRAICELKGKNPEFLYNGSEVRNLRELEELYDESESVTSEKELLSSWGELEVKAQ